jgi:3-hydroxyisobutyrate dehydrogenase-like beta-hydroxyacid dehydrogenase
MGAALGTVLRDRGLQVGWASAGRSAATRERAQAAGLYDAGSPAGLRSSDVILSVCPPHAAIEVARSLGRFEGVYVDANAVAPATARRVGGIVREAGGELVDAGIVGPPPREADTTRLHLSGASAPAVAGLFAGSIVDARVISDRLGDASALKMAYAAWTKGTAALLLAVRELAQREGVEEALLAEWSLSLPELHERHRRAAASAAAKGWRWVGEMVEIAATFEAADLPGGFHRAAAEVYRSR